MVVGSVGDYHVVQTCETEVDDGNSSNVLVSACQCHTVQA